MLEDALEDPSIELQYSGPGDQHVEPRMGHVPEAPGLKLRLSFPHSVEEVHVADIVPELEPWQVPQIIHHRFEFLATGSIGQVPNSTSERRNSTFPTSVYHLIDGRCRRVVIVLGSFQAVDCTILCCQP